MRTQFVGILGAYSEPVGTGDGPRKYNVAKLFSRQTQCSMSSHTHVIKRSMCGLHCRRESNAVTSLHRVHPCALRCIR